MLEARDVSRTQIEDLYTKLFDSGILDLDEEEEGMGNGVEGGEMETGAEEDSDADMASDPVSEAGKHDDEAVEEDGKASAPLGQVNGKA